MQTLACYARVQAGHQTVASLAQPTPRQLQCPTRWPTCPGPHVLVQAVAFLLLLFQIIVHGHDFGCSRGG